MNNTDEKHIQHTAFSPSDAQLGPEQQKSLSQPAPHLYTEQDMTWCRISHLND